MSLANLVQMLLHLRKQDPSATGLDWQVCARTVLLRQFGVEPTPEEVDELAKAGAAAAKGDDAFFEGWEPDNDHSPDRQTGGGVRVIRKSEPFGG